MRPFTIFSLTAGSYVFALAVMNNYRWEGHGGSVAYEEGEEINWGQQHDQEGVSADFGIALTSFTPQK
jgi:hypothetical protein